MSGADAGPLQRTVVLFEGRSDRLAFEVLARRRASNLAGLDLVVMDGITNLRTRMMALRGPGVRVLGLFDAAEGAYVARVLGDLGMVDARASDLTAIGFFGCERDLEEEVIRAAGAELVLETLAARGELERFRVFQRQPAQRVRSVAEQLHRFAGTTAGRKSRFAADIIEVLPMERMPAPLVGLLEAAAGGAQNGDPSRIM
ncbi:ATP-dependent endonuclease [Microbacterium sp. H1-D42]|uniref:ATP-dependent endonuclease n=1 Tax=Microbacterium sp. H1-D42 TaxID=2925844 RepID=UPI001F5306ED|nr:ATP-dependent endonuclease [Microbacterium sp. H1-D42]UNK71070.1 ATP-dependent endonuclease [Microbacterium sp. H1-D42]